MAETIMMRTKFPKGAVTTQTVGNIGLYYVCYRLSLYGWNVMPTARNAKGVDIITFNQNASSKITIQVKTLSKKNPVPLGAHMENLVADYVLVCVRNYPNEPMCFVLTPDEVKKLAHRGEKNGRVSYWLQTSAYDADTYREQWKRIGSGVTKGG